MISQLGMIIANCHFDRMEKSCGVRKIPPVGRNDSLGAE